MNFMRARTNTVNVKIIVSHLMSCLDKITGNGSSGADASIHNILHIEMQVLSEVTIVLKSFPIRIGERLILNKEYE